MSSTPDTLVAAPARPKPPRSDHPAVGMRLGYRISRLACQLWFITMMRGRVFGVHHVPRSGGALLVCNHQSFLDPVLATLALPREGNYMARDTLFANPRFKALIGYFNAFPVKRNTADLGAIKETLRRLKDGKIVLAFPEGTRTETGDVGPFHGGVVLLARKAHVPIVPTIVLGAFEAWPKDAKLPRPHPIVVAYDAPITLHDRPEWDDEACVTRIRERVIGLKARYESHSALKRDQHRTARWDGLDIRSAHSPMPR